MGVRAYKDKQGRSRFRVTFSRNGRRLVDERLPAGTGKEKAEHYYSKISGQWFDSDRLGIQKIPLISEVIQEYEKRIVPTLRSKYARSNIRAVGPLCIGKTLDQLPQVAEALRRKFPAWSPATLNYRFMFLKTMGKRAVTWKMADRDYGISITLSDIDNARQFYISKWELAQILRHAARWVREACWQLFYTGMRRGELYDATIAQGCYRLTRTKNGDPRVVPIPEAVKRIVGKPPYHRDVLTARFKKACQEAGYGHLTLHDLRHSMASQMLKSGASLGVIGMILGHRDLKSVKR